MKNGVLEKIWQKLEVIVEVWFKLDAIYQLKNCDLYKQIHGVRTAYACQLYISL